MDNGASIIAPNVSPKDYSAQSGDTEQLIPGEPAKDGNPICGSSQPSGSQFGSMR